MRRCFLALLLVVMMLLAGNGRVQAQAGYTHLIQPGDTWPALAWRYGIELDTLHSIYPHPNRQRQPVIGSTLHLPDAGQAATGRILRLNDGGLLATAVTHNRSPWQIARFNGLSHPYTPLLYRPLFMPGGSEPPRELPVGFTSVHPSRFLPLNRSVKPLSAANIIELNPATSAKRYII